MVHGLRALLRLAKRRAPEPKAAIPHSRTLRSTPESCHHRGGYNRAKRKKGSKIKAAVDTLGHLLALHLTPATEKDRVRVSALAKAVQEATGESVDWPTWTRDPSSTRNCPRDERWENLLGHTVL